MNLDPRGRFARQSLLPVIGGLTLDQTIMMLYSLLRDKDNRGGVDQSLRSVKYGMLKGIA